MVMTTGSVIRVSPDAAAMATDVLCDAFRDYPVMRYVIIDAKQYDEHLRLLIEFFVQARFHRNEPVLGIGHASDLTAVALVTLPGDRASPPALAEHRTRVWNTLGESARHRYEEFGRKCAEFRYPHPHLHLNMIGVRRSYAGRGLSRRLIDEVHELSREHPDARGVSLTTEDPVNVPLYQHLGYDIVGHVNISETLESWGFFRTNQEETDR